MINGIRIIGLTGMSGAGKSTVREMLSERYGLFTINCDTAAFEAVSRPEFLRELRERFPDDLLNGQGALDRAKTAAIIFGDSEKRSLYERILFPYIIYDIIEQIKRAKCDALLDAPTLFESGLDMICTETAAVIADRELCKKRIMKRDGITEENAEARLSSQHSAEFFRERCGLVIENNGSRDELMNRLNTTVHL